MLVVKNSKKLLDCHLSNFKSRAGRCVFKHCSKAQCNGDWLATMHYRCFRIPMLLKLFCISRSLTYIYINIGNTIRHTLFRFLNFEGESETSLNFPTTQHAGVVVSAYQVSSLTPSGQPVHSYKQHSRKQPAQVFCLLFTLTQSLESIEHQCWGRDVV